MGVQQGLLPAQSSKEGLVLEAGGRWVLQSAGGGWEDGWDSGTAAGGLSWAYERDPYQLNLLRGESSMRGWAGKCHIWVLVPQWEKEVHAARCEWDGGIGG